MLIACGQYGWPLTSSANVFAIWCACWSFSWNVLLFHFDALCLFSWLKLTVADFWLYGTLKAICDTICKDVWSRMGKKVRCWKIEFESLPQIADYLCVSGNPIWHVSATGRSSLYLQSIVIIITLLVTNWWCSYYHCEIKHLNYFIQTGKLDCK